MKYFLLVFSLIALRCCWGPTDYQLMLDKQDDDSILKELNGTYLINSLNRENISPYKLNISFNDSTKQVSGFSGCNRFFGTYSLDNGSLKFGVLGSTKMLCDDVSNKIETQLLKVFEKANLVLFTEHGFSFYDNKKLILSANKEVSYESLSLEYSAVSMGSYKQIIINKKTISTLQKSGGKSFTKACKKEDWDGILKALKPIDLNTISTLEVPSKDFQFDGDALAHLKISLNDSIYEAPPFDAGNPPKEIAKLVKEMVSISENVE
jgi:hypothetical protein